MQTGDKTYVPLVSRVWQTFHLIIDTISWEYLFFAHEIEEKKRIVYGNCPLGANKHNQHSIDIGCGNDPCCLHNGLKMTEVKDRANGSSGSMNCVSYSMRWLVKYSIRCCVSICIQSSTIRLTRSTRIISIDYSLIRAWVVFFWIWRLKRPHGK